MKVRFIMKSNNPDEMYKEYLTKHVQGVRKVYNEILRPILIEEGIHDSILVRIDNLIINHDKSKYSYEEWGPYRDYYYDPEHNSRSSVKYNQAWNHHQKHNPHHWQYWVLINDVDEPQFQPMDMPLEYVIEMLSDWQSAGQHYGNTAWDWYNKQKDKMLLSESTRKLVEKYIVYLK